MKCGFAHDLHIAAVRSRARTQAGYIGSHVVLKLVQAGFQVRACVRNAKDAEKVGHLRQMNNIETCDGSVELYEADMTVPGAYDVAFAGATCVFHVPTPVMIYCPCLSVSLSVSLCVAYALGGAGRCGDGEFARFHADEGVRGRARSHGACDGQREEERHRAQADLH